MLKHESMPASVAPMMTVIKEMKCGRNKRSVKRYYILNSSWPARLSQERAGLHSAYI